MNNDHQRQNFFRNVLHRTQAPFQSLLRRHTISTNNNNEDNIDEDMSDMPPLEYIDTPGTTTQQHTTVQHREATLLDDVAPSTSTSTQAPLSAEDVDVDMPPLQYLPSDDSSSDGGDDTDSMPRLQSVSNSSDSDFNTDSEDEVAMMPALQPIEDDNDPSWTDEDGGSDEEFNDMPSLEPIRPSPGRRRARVDDDEDNDRDRRHPSQRTAAGAGNNNNPNVPMFTVFGDVRLPNTDPHAQQDAMRFFAHMFSEGRAGNNGPQARATNNAQGGFNAIPLGPDFFNRAAGGNQGDNRNPFAEFFQNLDLAEILGMREPPEDPERAKKLVEGLEEVPSGLVKRMERVGGAPGAHEREDELGGSGCAICWDTLLDVETDENELTKKDKEEAGPSSESSTSTSSASDVHMADASSPAPTTTRPKIVCLPCAHVFHASCLIPWFTRPRQTTCPTCRFNIDPENLTYVKRRPTPRTDAGPQPATTAAAATPTQQAQQDPHPQPADAPQATPAQAQTFPSQTVPPQPGPQPNPQQQPQPAGAQPFDPRMFAQFMGPILTGVVPAGMIPAFQQSLNAAINAAAAGHPNGAHPIPVPGAGNGPNANAANNNNNPGNTANPGPNPGPGNNMPPGGGHVHEFITVDFSFSTALPFHPSDDEEPEPNTPPQFVPQFFVGDMHGGPIPVPGTAAGNQPGPGGVPLPFFPVDMDAFISSDARSNSNRRREKKKWTLPPAPGLTLRERVEEKEREAGLRCCDMSCGVGPFDDDPCPAASDASMKQLSIGPLKNSLIMTTSVCSHTFHPACLVSAERVAGWGGGEEKSLGTDVEVSCPVCRAVGCVKREEWEEGVKALT